MEDDYLNLIYILDLKDLKSSNRFAAGAVLVGFPGFKRPPPLIYHLDIIFDRGFRLRETNYCISCVYCNTEKKNCTILSHFQASKYAKPPKLPGALPPGPPPGANPGPAWGLRIPQNPKSTNNDPS